MARRPGFCYNTTDSSSRHVPPSSPTAAAPFSPWILIHSATHRPTSPHGPIRFYTIRYSWSCWWAMGVRRSTEPSPSHAVRFVQHFRASAAHPVRCRAQPVLKLSSRASPHAHTANVSASAFALHHAQCFSANPSHGSSHAATLDHGSDFGGAYPSSIGSSDTTPEHASSDARPSDLGPSDATTPDLGSSDATTREHESSGATTREHGSSGATTPEHGSSDATTLVNFDFPFPWVWIGRACRRPIPPSTHSAVSLSWSVVRETRRTREQKSSLRPWLEDPFESWESCTLARFRSISPRCARCANG